MFFQVSSLLALALAGSALATPIARSDALKVELSGAESVTSIDDVKITAAITNTGAEAVKVLKYGTIFDGDLMTRSFTVTKDDQDVAFMGIKMSISIPDLDDSAFATIASGETVTVQHAVGGLFDFEAAGEGAYSFQPMTSFLVVNGDSLSPATEMLKTEVASSALTMTITGDLAKREVPLEKRARNICTNSSYASFINSAYSEAKTLASTAASYVSSSGSSSLYRAYFGSISTSSVRSVLTAVANENSSSRTLSCVDSYNHCTSGVIAYTVTATTNIYLCPIFFQEVPSTYLCTGQTTVASRNVRGGTVLHELTHAVGGTKDVTYGCSADQALSDANSYVNADNYNCFSTQVYANQC
ncbi:Deuterolysin metalloprotease family-domain-containing protein [Schizophyllum amplum]|uniref:Neutral protease 2 n=1 Tax=Schizophyllum amplum TaxID=97359 RepID=A0A550CD56_9AGAR|nr:Deuterolysin metalloprotease family-domain-containing protein [Auriculariopsis ampla]